MTQMAKMMQMTQKVTLTTSSTTLPTNFNPRAVITSNPSTTTTTNAKLIDWIPKINNDNRHVAK